MGQQRPDRPGDGVTGLVLPPGDGEADVDAALLIAHAASVLDREQRVIGLRADLRQPLENVLVDRTDTIHTVGFDRRITGVVGTAVDHPLAHTVHGLPVHIGQAGHQTQRLPGQTAGDVGGHVRPAVGVELGQHPVGHVLEGLAPDLPDRAG